MKLCHNCALAFHLYDVEKADPDCECRMFGCGCRKSREQKKAA